MTKIEHGGFIVHNNEAIWGVGDTADAAWTDFLNMMDMSGVRVLGDDEDSEGLDGSWTRERDYRISSASKGLLAVVASEGGDCSWGKVGIIACTGDEMDAA